MYAILIIYITVIYNYVHNLFKQVYVHIIIMKIVKLKKVLSRRDEKGEFYRYDVTVPNKAIEDLKWEEVKELEYEVKGKELRIKKK